MEKYYKIGSKVMSFISSYELDDYELLEKFSVLPCMADIEYVIKKDFDYNGEIIKKFSPYVDEIYYIYKSGVIKKSYINTNGLQRAAVISYPGINKRIFVVNNNVAYKNIKEIFRDAEIQSSLIKEGILFFHSNYIIYKDSAILFTGPSGAGKSTQGFLWEEYSKAEIINGDKSALAFKNGQLYAYGVPFCGSSKICKNVSAPIKAIVLVNKAKNNSVIELDKKESFKILLGQISINRFDNKEYELAIRMIEKIIQSVDIVKLNCTPDKRAVKVLDDYLK